MLPWCKRGQQLVDLLALLELENELRRQKLALMLRKPFGKNSDALDPAQFGLLLDEPPGNALTSLPPDVAPAEPYASSAARTGCKLRRERISVQLPVVEEVLLARGVKAIPGYTEENIRKLKSFI